MLKGFREFVLRGNVVDLAVAVIIAAAFTDIVNALVADLITPLIAAFGGQPDFSALTFTINNSQFMIGHFINTLLAFLIVAAVLYFVIVAPLNRIAAMRAGPTTEPEATTRTCPECLSQIPVAARRCAFCTAAVTPPTPTLS